MSKEEYDNLIIQLVDNMLNIMEYIGDDYPDEMPYIESISKEHISKKEFAYINKIIENKRLLRLIKEESEEMNKLDLFVTSPTSLSNGYVEWWGLDTKLVGRVKAILENHKELQQRIDETAEDLATLFGTDDEDINCIIRKLKGEVNEQ